jgi:hypothetical protein
MVHRALFGGGTPPLQSLANGDAAVAVPKKGRTTNGAKTKKP